MTHTLKTLMASLVAATIASAALVTPAHAGGSISINLEPKNAKQENAMRAGLTIYAIVNAVENGSIKQIGNGNSAGLGQLGSGNLGIIHQEGDNHNGTLVQNGDGNACGLFQFGKGTNADVVQNGNGKTCATFAFGW
jgi:minor curlin subunit